MAGHSGDGHHRLTRNQGERKDELIGEIRIDGAARREKLQQLVHGFVGHALGRLAPLSEREEASPGVLELRPQKQESSRGVGLEAHRLQIEHRRPSREPARGLVPLPQPDARIESGDGRDAPDGPERPAIRDADRLKALCRPDDSSNDPAPRRIEPRPRHLDFGVEADRPDRGEPLDFEVIETGAPAHMRASAKIDPRRRRCQTERRQDRLEHEGRRPGGSDVEGELAGSDLARLEDQRLRTEARALDAGTADGRHGLDGLEVLRLQPRRPSPGADLRDAEGLARDRRERQRAAEELAAPLTPGAVDFDHKRLDWARPEARAASGCGSKSRLNCAAEHLFIIPLQQEALEADRVELLDRLEAEVLQSPRGGVFPALVGVGLNFHHPYSIRHG